MPLGDSDRLQVGDWVLAAGNPFGLSHTLTAGIVSARDRVIGAGPYDDFIQTDASINPGNSGGPLFDQHGRVVGINTAIFSQSGGNIGIGFATPINLARAIVDQLRASGKVTRGWLGVSIQPLGPDLRQALGLGDTEGALIADVIAKSPAEASGLKRGDVVIGIDGKPVTEPGQLSRTIATMPPGSTTEPPRHSRRQGAHPRGQGRQATRRRAAVAQELGRGEGRRGRQRFRREPRAPARHADRSPPAASSATGARSSARS